MVNVIDTAFVEILPDLSRFTEETERQLDQAFTEIQNNAERSLSDLEDAFSETASNVGESLDDIDPEFSAVEEAASAAAEDVASSFDDIDPEFSGIVDGATSAADEVGGAFDGVGEEVADEFDTAGEESSSFLQQIADTARSVADSVGSFFSGTGEEVADEFEEASDGVDTLDSSLARLAAAAGGVAAIRAATLAAEELNSQLIILESQFDETGTLAGFTRDQLQDLSEASSIRLGVNTSDLIRAQQSIALFTDLTGQEFTRTIELSADLAAFMGREVPDAARLLARGLDDPQRGLQLLERQVGAFDEGLIEAVESMLELGDTAGAQSLILDEIESRFGGVAEASADTTARLTEAGAALGRTFGQGVIGPLDDNADQLLRTVESFAPVAENLGQVTGLTVEIIAELSPAIEGVARVLGGIPPDFLAAAAAGVAFNRALTLIRRNPVVATLTGVSAAIGAIVGQADEAALSVAEVDLSLDRLSRGNVDAEAQQLVDTFTNLADVSVDVGDRISAIGLFSASDFDIFRAFNTGAVEAREFDEQVQAASEDFAAFDQQLASLAAGGSADQVNQILGEMQDRTGLTADEFDRLTAQILPDTTVRLQQTAEAADEVGIATQAVGEAIEAVGGDSEPTAVALANLTIALRDSEDAAGDAAVVEAELGIASRDLLEITPQVAEVFEALAQSVVTNMPSVGTAVDNALAAAQEAEQEFTFDNFVTELETALTNARNFNENVGLLIEAGFTDIARVAIERGPEFAAAAADALSDPQILRQAEGLMDDLSTEVDTGLNNAAQVGFREAGAAGNRIIDGFETGTRGAGGVGRGAANDVAEGINQRSGRASSRARALMSGAISSARARADQSSSVGFGFGQGVIEGINNQVSNVRTAAANVAAAAVGAASRFLSIQSPSRVTAREIGLPFSQGIAMGISEGQDEVDRTFESMMSNLLDRTFQPVRLGDVSDMEWDRLLDAGWRGDPTDRMEALYPPGFDAGDVGRRLGPQADIGPQIERSGGDRRVVLELRSDGGAVGDFLLEQLRRSVRVQGGDVQEVLGSGTGGTT